MKISQAIPKLKALAAEHGVESNNITASYEAADYNWRDGELTCSWSLSISGKFMSKDFFAHGRGETFKAAFDAVERETLIAIGKVQRIEEPLPF